MNKKLKTTAFLILTSILMFSCSEKKFVEYKPHYSDDGKRTFGNPELSSEELKNTIQVLEYYGEEYQTKENIILITKKLNDNWEVIWNYTTKSNDENWLKNHQP